MKRKVPIEAKRKDRQMRNNVTKIKKKERKIIAKLIRARTKIDMWVQFRTMTTHRDLSLGQMMHPTINSYQ